MKTPSPVAGHIVAALMQRPHTLLELLERLPDASVWTVRSYVQMYKKTGVLHVARTRNPNNKDAGEVLALGPPPVPPSNLADLDDADLV